jgi:hypothetical protein
VRGLLRVAAARGDVQADQRLAGTWHARHEADQLPSLATCLLDEFFHPGGRDAQVDRARIVPRDRLDAVSGIERAGGFDDRRRGAVRCCRPPCRIEAVARQLRDRAFERRVRPGATDIGPGLPRIRRVSYARRDSTYSLEAESSKSRQRTLSWTSRISSASRSLTAGISIALIHRMLRRAM